MKKLFAAFAIVSLIAFSINAQDRRPATDDNQIKTASVAAESKAVVEKPVVKTEDTNGKAEAKSEVKSEVKSEGASCCKKQNAACCKNNKGSKACTTEQKAACEKAGKTEASKETVK